MSEGRAPASPEAFPSVASGRTTGTSSGRFRGLTKGDRRATQALGVEPLAPDEISKPVRIRAPREVHERLQQMSAREIGELLAQTLTEG